MFFTHFLMHLDFILKKGNFTKRFFTAHFLIKKCIEIETTIILNYHARYVDNQIIFIHEIMNINSATWHSLLPPLKRLSDAEKAIL